MYLSGYFLSWRLKSFVMEYFTAIKNQQKLLAEVQVNNFIFNNDFENKFY